MKKKIHRLYVLLIAVLLIIMLLCGCQSEDSKIFAVAEKNLESGLESDLQNGYLNYYKILKAEIYTPNAEDSDNPDLATQCKTANTHIIYEMRLGNNTGEDGLIHQLADLFIAHARQIGVALPAVHGIEAEHHIVIVPCAVARRAPENVAERARLAVAALLLDNAHDVVQLFKADAAQHAGDIFDPGHMIPLPSVFFPKQYHTIILRKNLLLF